MYVEVRIYEGNRTGIICFSIQHPLLPSHTENISIDLLIQSQILLSLYFLKFRLHVSTIKTRKENCRCQRKTIYCQAIM